MSDGVVRRKPDDDLASGSGFESQPDVRRVVVTWPKTGAYIFPTRSRLRERVNRLEVRAPYG